MSNTRTLPEQGYILPIWDQTGSYRATAIAYLEREGLFTVEHENGNWYTLEELKAARIG